MLTESGPILLLKVKVVPNSSRTCIAGTLGVPPHQHLKIKVAQPPEDSRANRAVIELLARILKISASRVVLSAGHSQPRKTFSIQGLSLPQAQSLIQSALDTGS